MSKKEKGSTAAKHIVLCLVNARHAGAQGDRGDGQRHRHRTTATHTDTQRPPVPHTETDAHRHRHARNFICTWTQVCQMLCMDPHIDKTPRLRQGHRHTYKVTTITD